MRVAGIIAEYNPFHNGHKFQIEETKRITQSDFVIVAMSGNFAQRGEPTIIDKWSRTRMALLGGADLVIELPIPFVLTSAEGFAKGGVTLLEKTGVVNSLCFGSESGSIEELLPIAEIISKESSEFKLKLKESLNSGLSYPAAIAKAIPNFDSSPNNILAIEYLKSLIQINSSIKPFTIKRKGSGYNEKNLEGVFSSATAIRNAIFDQRLNEIQSFLPFFDELKNQIDLGRGPVFTDKFFDCLKILIRRMSAEEIKNYPMVSEGLENRIIDAFSSGFGFSKTMDLILTKRYPETRIMRTLMCILNDITQDKIHRLSVNGPEYIRILGVKKTAFPLVREMKNKALLPVSSRLIDFIKSKSPTVIETARLESLATDIFVTAFPFGNKSSGQDFTTNSIII